MVQECSVRKYFGTDGIRCVAGVSPLDPESLVRLGRAVGEVFLNNHGKRTVIIGKDTRLSGYMIENALVAGITSVGANVRLTGPLPTPGLSYLTRSMRSDAGIMISASHNPYEDNGIKIFASDGYKLPDEVELKIESLMQLGALDGKVADPADIGKAFRLDDAVGRYTVYLKNCFPRELSLDGLRIGLDCANGAAYVVAPQVFEELGAEVVSRGISPNGRNINAGFGSLYPEIVRKLVVEQNLHLGNSLDGEADRVIFSDEKGNVLDGDMIIAICAVYLKEHGLLPKNQIVATVMSNLGLEKFLGQHGISVIRSQVGDRYVLEEMRKEQIALGGEQSGHVIFADSSTTGDGILTALKVLEIMVRSGKTVSELTAGYQKFPQKLISIKVSQKPLLSTLPEVCEAIKKVEDELKEGGRVLVRYSGTENKARVMVECESEDRCQKYAADLAEVLEKTIGE